VSSLRKTRHPEIRLPAVLAIGFTGHRHLPDEPKCRELLCNFLAEKKAAMTGILYGVCSVAEGADLLFAESCVQLGIPLRVLLPFPKEDFLKDFDAATRARCELVMQSAISVEVTGDLAFPEPEGFPEQRYYECGIETVQRSQLIVALWDGGLPRGLGGTAEIVAFASAMGKPVVCFHSVTGDVQTFNRETDSGFGRDPELMFLNQLPDRGIPLPDNSSVSPTIIAQAWFRKLDANASRMAPQVRRLASIPIVCTAAAALVSAVASRTASPGISLAIGAALGITAAALPAMLRLSKRQILWARTRTATEVCRSVLSLWDAPGMYRVIGPEVIPELADVLGSLNLLKSLCADVAVPIEDFKTRYVGERVAHQIEYFSKHARESAREAKRFRVVAWCGSGIAIAISVWTFVGGTLLGIHNATSGKRLAIAASFLFQISTVAGALLVVNDCDRRQRRYRELHDSLIVWDRELKALKTWPTVLQVAVRIEKALLVEIIEWKSLIRNRKMPRN
jgi:hypothetical protein